MTERKGNSQIKNGGQARRSKLFADLYRGATAFKTFAGIYKCDDGKILHDTPILVESYVQRQDLENQAKLLELLKFAAHG